MNSIVLSVCERHGVSADDFFSRRRTRKIIACRRDAIDALRQKGFSLGGCARMMRRDISTISYWLKPQIRQTRLTRMNARKSRLSELVAIRPCAAMIKTDMGAA